MSSVSWSCIMSCLSTSPQYLFDLPLLCWKHPLPTSYTFARGHSCISFRMPKSSQSRFLYLVLHCGYSHLVSDMFISNPISPSKPTHLSWHPYFCNFYLLNLRVLDWTSLRSIHSWSNHHSIELASLLWWHLLIIEDFEREPSFY